MLRKSTCEQNHEFTGTAHDDRPLWLAAIVAVLAAAALAMGWNHYSQGNCEHDRVRWDTRHQSFQPEPNHSRRSLPPQLRYVVQIYACCYFALFAGLLAFLAIRALAQRWQRDERSDRDVVDEGDW